MELAIQLLGQTFRVAVDGADAEVILRMNYAQVQHAPLSSSPVRYRLEHRAGQFLLHSDEGISTSTDAGEFLYLFEHRLVLDLQKARPDLLFVHAAVLFAGARSVLLVAPSGTGKSTLALALVERGCAYLSDELAPIEPDDGVVHPYPHALCLKGVPAGRTDYPPQGFVTGATWHLPAEHLRCRLSPAPLGTLMFLERGGSHPVTLTEISAAEATARLLPQVLNGLAHGSFGIDAALAVAKRCRALVVRMGGVDETADLVAEFLRAVVQEQSREQDGYLLPGTSGGGG